MVEYKNEDVHLLSVKYCLRLFVSFCSSSKIASSKKNSRLASISWKPLRQSTSIHTYRPYTPGDEVNGDISIQGVWTWDQYFLYGCSYCVTIMAYETILEGRHLIQHPAESQGGLWINVFVLILNLLIDGAILVNAMKEINVEARANSKGFEIVTGSFKNVGRAAPPTRFSVL